MCFVSWVIITEQNTLLSFFPQKVQYSNTKNTVIFKKRPSKRGFSMAVRTFEKVPGISPLKGFGGSFGVRGYCFIQNRDIYIIVYVYRGTWGSWRSQDSKWALVWLWGHSMVYTPPMGGVYRPIWVFGPPLGGGYLRGSIWGQNRPKRTIFVGKKAPKSS